MISERFSSNTNTSWPFTIESVSTGNGKIGASLFADGAVVKSAADADIIVKVASLQIVEDKTDGIFSLRFRVYKLNSDLSEVLSESVELEIRQDAPTFEVVSRGWFYFVVDCERVIGNPGYEADTELFVDPRAMDVIPDAVTSISIYNRNKDGSLVQEELGITGSIKILAGTNVYLGTDSYNAGRSQLLPVNATSAQNQAKSGDTLVIDAIPGLGEGRIPCQTDDIECLPDYGNVIPDQDGDVVIDADPCYQISPEFGKVVITGRCRPCCECDDYNSTGELLADQTQRIVNISKTFYQDRAFNNRAMGLAQEYADLVSAVENQAMCPPLERDRFSLSVYSSVSKSFQKLSHYTPKHMQHVVMVTAQNMSCMDVTASVEVLSDFSGGMIEGDAWWITSKEQYRGGWGIGSGENPSDHKQGTLNRGRLPVGFESSWGTGGFYIVMPLSSGTALRAVFRGLTRADISDHTARALASFTSVLPCHNGGHVDLSASS